MKLSNNGLKSITKKPAIAAEVLRNYLINLYGDPNYEEKDKAYVLDTDPAAVHEYRQRGDTLVKKLVDLSDLPEFAKLSKHFTEDISKGALRSTVNSIKEFCEVICYDLQNLHDQGKPVPYQLKAALAISTLDACPPGALTNIQNILFSLSDSLYERKYDFIQRFVNGYIEEHHLYDKPGNIVHFVNEFMNRVSEIYGLTVPEDLYRTHSDHIILERFVRDLEEYLSGREGAYRFAEFLAQYHAGSLPDIPKDGINIRDDEGNYTEGFKKITMLCGTLSIPMSDLCYETKRKKYPIDPDNPEQEEDMIHYNNDHAPNVSVIQAAIIWQLIDAGIIEQKEFLVQKEEFIPSETIYLRDKHEKLVKDEHGRPVTNVVYGSPVTVNNDIIEGPGAWVLTSKFAEKISFEEKILDTKRLRYLTKDGKNFEDWMHDGLKDSLNQGLKFHEALSSFISQETLNPEDIDLNLTENEESKEDVDTENINLNFIEKADNNEESKDDLELGDIQLEDQKDDNISKKLFLLSDQIELIKGYCSNEEIESMSIVDIKKWLDFIELLKTPETAGKIDSILKYIISDGNESMLDAYIKSADDGLTNKILNRMKNLSDHKGNTLLNIAVSKNKIDLVRRLIFYGVNPNIQNSDGKTALHYANDEEIMALLIQNGAKMDVIDKHKKAALDYAVDKGNREAISLLVSQGAYIYNTLKSCIIANDVEAIELLLKGGVGVNKRNGETHLHASAKPWLIEVAEFFIKNGEDVNAKDKDGRTPLHYLIGTPRCVPMVNLLIENGANATLVDKYGKTPLDYAIDVVDSIDDDDDYYGYDEMDDAISSITALLNGMSNIDDIQVKKLMELACFNNNVPLASKLLEIGVDVMQKNEDGYMLFYDLIRSYYRDPEALSEILKESKNPEEVIMEIIKLDDIMRVLPGYDKWKIVEATLKKIPQNKRDDVIKEASKLPNAQEIIMRKLFNAVIEENVSKRREDYKPKESFAELEKKKKAEKKKTGRVKHED